MKKVARRGAASLIPRPATVTDRDGRVVGVYEFGDPAGTPVIAFHGVPACGAGFAFANESAREHGIRLLAPDRPGVGLSAPLDGWTVGSYASILVALADVRAVEQFGVWGWSGGGPYAVACAAAYPDRVTSMAISAGMGEVGVWAQPSDFEKTDRQMLALARRRPLLARLMMGLNARLAKMSPTSAAKSFAKQLSESDRAVLEELGTAAEAMALFTQAFVHGARGVIDDYRAIGQPWGIDLGAITAPTKIFQGDADTMVPARHSYDLAERIRDAELVVWPGEGHLALIPHVSGVLDWLVSPRSSSVSL